MTHINSKQAEANNIHLWGPMLQNQALSSLTALFGCEMVNQLNSWGL